MIGRIVLRIEATWARALSRVRSATWFRPLIKAMAVLCGLIVLAWLGRRSSVHTAAAALPASIASAPAIAAPPSIPAPSSTPAPTSAHATETAPVYLNAANVDDLRRLPGIGPKRAQAILDLRAKQGRFHQVEDLLKVRGIGRATLRRLRPLVRLDPPPPAIVDASPG